MVTIVTALLFSALQNEEWRLLLLLKERHRRAHSLYVPFFGQVQYKDFTAPVEVGSGLRHLVRNVLTLRDMASEPSVWTICLDLLKVLLSWKAVGVLFLVVLMKILLRCVRARRCKDPVMAKCKEEKKRSGKKNASSPTAPVSVKDNKEAAQSGKKNRKAPAQSREVPALCDVAEEVKSEVVTDDVAEEVKSEVVTDDVAEELKSGKDVVRKKKTRTRKKNRTPTQARKEVKSEVVTDDVAEEVKSGNDVVRKKKTRTRKKNRTPAQAGKKVKSEVVTDDVAEEVKSEVVTDVVAQEVKSEVVTDVVAEEVKSEVVTDDVTEEVKSGNDVVRKKKTRTRKKNRAPAQARKEVKSEVVTEDVAEEVKSEVVIDVVAQEVKSGNDVVRKKTRTRKKNNRTPAQGPRKKNSAPAEGSGNRARPVRESGKNRTPAKESDTPEAGNDNFRRERRWLEFLEMPTEERELVQKETPSIEDEFGIKIKFPARRNYIILQGGRQGVTQACLKLKRLVDLSRPSGIDLLAEVNNTSSRVRPSRIWPCGNVLRMVNADPSLHGVVIGRSGQTVQGIRNKYCVDIYVPGKTEEYKTIDIVGRREDVEPAKKELLWLIRQSTRRSSRMYGNAQRQSIQSYETTSRRRGPKAVSGDVAERVKSEVVTDDVAEEVKSEVVTDDVAQKVKSEVVTDDVAEEVKSEVVTDDVAEEVKCEVVTDDVAQKVKSEVVTDDVAEEVKSEVVTDDVAQKVKSEVVTDDVAEEVKSEVVTDDVAEEVKSDNDVVRKKNRAPGQAGKKVRKKVRFEVVTDDVAEEVKSEVVTDDVAQKVKSEVVTDGVAEEVKSEAIVSGDDWAEDTEGFWSLE
ncbi:uncharacterized protein [Panulirus ornatus]|uniref:uncharacterized protein n=1 Tax=Panulirus ornatus TaxID=150431 RepID=UPI003A8457DF